MNSQAHVMYSKNSTTLDTMIGDHCTDDRRVNHWRGGGG